MKDNGYKMLHKIGEGPASTVYLVSDRVGQHFAAKVVRYDVTQYKASKCSQRDWQNFHNEATQLSMLSHPCIIKLRECFVNGEDDLVLVTDYCPGSTLSDYIKSSTQLLPETLILDWLVQLCLALRYLHRNGIIHRDIKSSNIFFTDQGRVKLGDFGACRSLQEGELLLSTAGTPSYLPPEMLASDYGEAAQKGFSNKQDMWALGIVLYQACTKSLPFEGYCINDIFEKIKNGYYHNIPSCYSKDLSGLVESLLASNEELRPSVEEVMRLGFIRQRIRCFYDDLKQASLQKQKSRLQELSNRSPEARSASGKPQQERSTGVQQSVQPLSFKPYTRLFEISDSPNHRDQEKKMNLEQQLFCKAVIPSPNLKKPTQSGSFEASPERSSFSRHNLTFGTIEFSGSHQPSKQRSTDKKFINARNLTVVSSKDIIHNHPVICLRDK